MIFAANSPDLNLSEILNQIETRMFIKNTKGEYLACNSKFAKDARLEDPKELFGKCDYDLIWNENAEDYRNDDFKVIQSGIPIINKIEPQKTPSGKIKYLITSKYPLKNKNNKIIGLMGLYNDITELKQTELKQLELQKNALQNQKMESLGLLAGRIAHDFNNYLLSIIGNLDLIMNEYSSHRELIELLNEVKQNTQELTKLTKQLLAYSGKGKFTLSNIILNDAIAQLSQLIKATIPKHIQLNYQLNKEIAPIEGDIGQIQQMIINLLNNAVEAIGDQRGTITITTGMRDCDGDYILRNKIGNQIKPGRYVFIEITDTGYGITPELQDKIFEPFFTTKESAGGLGLPAVLGIVKGHEGAIIVYSEPKKGTTIKCLFPAKNQTIHIIPVNNQYYFETPFKNETIMVVDDEPMVRATLKRILEKFGYKVILAENGEEAVELYKSFGNDIHLIIMDLTMPKMDGGTAFSTIKLINPDVKVILSSGYNEQEISQRFVSKGLAGFLQKPYEMKELIDKIKKVLKH